ncbi:protein transport protein bet1 [Geranomyces variabilis]|uniref:Protein transport protein bet1 n=1 Tax=Geranomyces variabilis TaxID=109894 RepID=A0AAD5XQR4_9FUNG|nr:protein transport protein bet1 [Geranomyces variabilis]
MSQRARPSRPQYSYGAGGSGFDSGAGYNYALEQDNDERAGILGDKLSQLKQISIAIGDELNLQKGVMRDLGEGLENTGDLLSNTMRRFAMMAKKQNGRWMWYLIFFVLAVFLYVYLFRYRR